MSRAAWLLVALPALAPAASIGLGYSAGSGYQAESVDCRLALDADSGLDALGGAMRSQIEALGGPITAFQYWIGAARAFSPARSASGELTYGSDAAGSLSFFGPSLRARYVRLPEGASAAGGGDERLEREIEQALSDSPSSPPGEAFALSAGLDAFVYSLASGGSAFTRVNPAGKTITTQSPGAIFHVYQLCLSAGLEVPLWDGVLRPSISGSYNLYSQDYGLAGQVKQLQPSSPQASRSNPLISGLLVSSWQAALGATLPFKLLLQASYGRQLLVEPRQWVEIYAAQLSRTFFNRLRAELGSSYAIQENAGQWLLNVGLRAYF